MRIIRWGGRLLLLAGAVYLAAGLSPLLRGGMVDERLLLPAVVLFAFGWVTVLLVSDREPEP